MAVLKSSWTEQLNGSVGGVGGVGGGDQDVPTAVRVESSSPNPPLPDNTAGMYVQACGCMHIEEVCLTHEVCRDPMQSMTHFIVFISAVKLCISPVCMYVCTCTCVNIALGNTLPKPTSVSSFLQNRTEASEFTTIQGCSKHSSCGDRGSCSQSACLGLLWTPPPPPKILH